MFRYVKRSELTQGRSLAVRFGAIVLALLVTGIFLLAMGLNPIDVYASMVKGAFGNENNVKQTIIEAIPLCLSALGIALAFKMQFWNIGGEGQIMMGAFAAAFIALKIPNLPKPVMLISMTIAGILGGGLWALIPAFFKAKWKTNETIVTLMMNYIAIKWVTYLQNGPWKEGGFPKIADFGDNAILPNLFGIHIGWVITLVMVVFMYILMNRSKLGYEVAVLGESEKTAKYAGINIRRTIIVAVIIGGGLSGLAGMIQASAVSNTLSSQVSGGLGFTAIIVAWLSNLSAPAILIVSILFAGLINGGGYIQAAFNIPSSAALILQGLILFFVLGGEFFVRYKVVFVKSSRLAKEGEKA